MPINAGWMNASKCQIGNKSIQFHSIQFNSCLLICLNYNRHIEASHWSATLDIESSPEPIINLTEVKGPEMEEEEEEEEDNIEG